MKNQTLVPTRCWPIPKIWGYSLAANVDTETSTDSHPARIAFDYVYIRSICRYVCVELCGLCSATRLVPVPLANIAAAQYEYHFDICPVPSEDDHRQVTQNGRAHVRAPRNYSSVHICSRVCEWVCARRQVGRIRFSFTYAGGEDSPACAAAVHPPSAWNVDRWPDRRRTRTAPCVLWRVFGVPCVLRSATSVYVRATLFLLQSSSYGETIDRSPPLRSLSGSSWSGRAQSHETGDSIWSSNSSLNLSSRFNFRRYLWLKRWLHIQLEFELEPKDKVPTQACAQAPT